MDWKVKNEFTYVSSLNFETLKNLVIIKFNCIFGHYSVIQYIFFKEFVRFSRDILHISSNINSHSHIRVLTPFPTYGSNWVTEGNEFTTEIRITIMVLILMMIIIMMMVMIMMLTVMIVIILMMIRMMVMVLMRILMIMMAMMLIMTAMIIMIITII